MEPKSLNIIPRVLATSLSVIMARWDHQLYSKVIAPRQLNHKSMKSDMTGISVYVWVSLVEGKAHNKTVGPIMWSGCPGI